MLSLKFISSWNVSLHCAETWWEISELFQPGWCVRICETALPTVLLFTAEGAWQQLYDDSPDYMTPVCKYIDNYILLSRNKEYSKAIDYNKVLTLFKAMNEAKHILFNFWGNNNTPDKLIY